MKILIVYASKQGGSEQAAKYLATKLTVPADCFDVNKVGAKNLQEYDCIILGWAVYAGRVMQEIVNYCTQNLDVLLTKKVVLFVCCLRSDNALKYIGANFPGKLVDHAFIKTSFGGEIRTEKLTFMMRKMVEAIRKRQNLSDKATINYEEIDKLASIINNGIWLTSK